MSKNNITSTVIGILLLLFGAPTGFLLSELTKKEIAQLQEVGATANVDTITLQALLAVDIGSFLSLVGLVILSIKLAGFVRNKIEKK